MTTTHGVIVAIYQGNQLWPMFGFGFGSIFVLTQMYGLGLNRMTRRVIFALFLIAMVLTYALMGRLRHIHEVLRIPVLDYAVVGLLYLVFLAGNVFLKRRSV